MFHPWRWPSVPDVLTVLIFFWSNLINEINMIYLLSLYFYYSFYQSCRKAYNILSQPISPTWESKKQSLPITDPGKVCLFSACPFACGIPFQGKPCIMKWRHCKHLQSILRIRILKAQSKSAQKRDWQVPCKGLQLQTQVKGAVHCPPLGSELQVTWLGLSLPLSGPEFPHLQSERWGWAFVSTVSTDWWPEPSWSLSPSLLEWTLTVHIALCIWAIIS